MRIHRIAIVLGLSTLASAQSPQETRFTLVCHYGEPTAGYFDKNIEVDVAAQTADHLPALITDGEIRWQSRTDSFAFESSINRYTGAMLINGTTGNPPRTLNLYGSCAKVTARKF